METCPAGTRLLMLALAAMIGCSDPEAPPRPRATPSVIRLIERLDAAQIESALLDLPAGAEAASDRSERVFSEDFDRETPHLARLAENPRCAVESWIGGEEGDRALRCWGMRLQLFEVSVEPSTHYRVGFSSIRNSENCRSFTLVESRDEVTPGQTSGPRPEPGRRYQGYVVHVHPLAESAPGDWEAHHLELRTRAETRSVLIEYVGEPGCHAWLDELTIDRLELTPEQELARLRDSQLAPGADPSRGIAKHGRLLPTDPDRKSGAYERNHDVRDALFAPAPSTFRFRLTPRPRARLLFGYGLSVASRPGDAAEFRIGVRIVPETDDRQVFGRSIEVGEDGEGWHWHQGSVDLAEFAGREIELSLETTAPAGSRGYAVWSAPTVDVPRSDQDPPNVILIAIDTLRADRLSSYGAQDADTPAIDGLARDGVLFVDAITASNWTVASFSSIFSSLMPRQHGTYTNDAVLPGRLTTLTEYLRREGWATGAILYKAPLIDMGLDQGFDDYFNVPDRLPSIERNVDRTLEWLDRNGDRRFFLFFHADEPHQPFSQPPEFVEPNDIHKLQHSFGIRLPIFVGSRLVMGLIGAQGEERRGCYSCISKKKVRPELKAIARRLYSGAVEYTDREIGRFLRELRERGLYDDALIILLSDHGELLWEHGEVFGHGSPIYYDGLTRVPLIIKPPVGRGLARDKRVETQVRTIDLMPTVLDLLEIDASGHSLQGESLLPLLRSGGGARADLVAVSEVGRGLATSVRSGRWKYLRRSSPELPEALFDLESDPAEDRDVASENPEILRELRLHGLASMMRGGVGRYVMVVGPPTDRLRRVAITLEGPVAGSERLFGIARRFMKDPVSVRFEAVADDPLILLARVDTDSALHVELDPRPHGPAALTRDFPAGAGDPVDVAELIRRARGVEEPAIYVYDPVEIVRHETGREMGGDQIRALKALGYIE